MVSFLGSAYRFSGSLKFTMRILVVVAAGIYPCWHVARAADDGGVTVESVAYQGWKNNLRMSNGDAELLVTLEVGPRILSYRLQGGRNIFKEYPEQLGKSGEGAWMMRGGH